MLNLRNMKFANARDNVVKAREARRDSFEKTLACAVSEHSSYMFYTRA
jgi:hypothetical protein